MEKLGPSCELPICPNCGNPMELTQAWRGSRELAERSSFECKDCRIVFTEIVTGASAIPERVSALYQEPHKLLQ
jgi:transposase-like protein